MRYGISFVPGMSYREVIDLAQRAEAAGYDSLYIPDQTFHRDPWGLLALCAQATTSITLGLAVTNPYTRHIIQIARGAGLLSEVSDGRFLLGLGTGNRPRVLNGLGMTATRPVERIREAIVLIRRLLSGETITYESTGASFNEVSLDFLPPYPVPLYIGTRGPRMLTLAGEVADGVLMEGLFTTAGLDFALKQVERGASEAGRSMSDITSVAWQSLRLGDDPNMASSDAARAWAALLIRTTQRDVLRHLGITDETVDAVLEDAERFGEEGAGRRVTAQDVVKLLLIGTPEQVREQIARVQARGVDGLACIILGDYDYVRSAMDRFAREVMGGRSDA